MRRRKSESRGSVARTPLPGGRTRWLLMAVLLFTGCGSSRPPYRPFLPSMDGTVRIVVQNRNFADARLYYNRRGTRMSLGIAPGKKDTSFILDWDFSDPMSIEINLLAGPRCVTEEIQVEPGDVLELQIAPVFSDTSGCR